MIRRLKTRVNSNGYREFFDEVEGRWVSTHRRAYENATGREVPLGNHVHHINGDKLDNRRSNLVALASSVHTRIHRVDPDACFRCGRSGHWAQDCYASTNFKGEALDGEEDDWLDDEEWDEDDDW